MAPRHPDAARPKACGVCRACVEFAGERCENLCKRCGETGNVEFDSPNQMCNICVDEIQDGGDSYHTDGRCRAVDRLARLLEDGEITREDFAQQISEVSK